jgi:hypothetical protein
MGSRMYHVCAIEGFDALWLSYYEVCARPYLRPWFRWGNNRLPLTWAFPFSGGILHLTLFVVG